MESIYDPKTFKTSDHLALDDYFKSYGEICHFAEPIPRYNCIFLENDDEYLERIQHEMNIDISREELRILAANCSLSTLTLSDEPKNVIREVPDNLHTRSKLDNVYPTNNSARQLNVIMCLGVLENKYDLTTDFKFGNKRFIKTTTVSSNQSVSCNIMPGTNFIYSIIVYKPYSINYSQRNSGGKLRFAFEIEALGTNTLAEVADKIYCIFNTGLFREVENTKVDLKPLMNAKAHYPSQCIYIDGVLYNDFRSPKAIDCSAKIIEWANDKNIGKFKSELMEKTALNSLKPRLGYPYVYMHQGNCEHLFTFSDARLLQPGDCLNSRKYPRVTSTNRVSNILCFICNVMNAQWIVLECAKLPHEKVYLCTECCNSYLFVDGKKVTEFRLYPYYDQEMLTKHLSGVVVE
ncbi:uncharacterized protein LOC108912977 [Anoplophora glabripennis]|uniref:uncharacterized protein LOC108912977 n=1 Tax=Anoplophora glabripennis TaxID=217634 RepID=UPI000873F6CC|nr:uncharacterized protein LOC108912977 [Anoplophora glabripennis]